MNNKDGFRKEYCSPRIEMTEVYLEHVIAGTPTGFPNGGNTENLGQLNANEDMDYADQDYVFDD